MTITRVFPLVTSAWLRQRLMPVLTNSTKKNTELHDTEFRLLDTSWLPEPHVDGYKDFYQKAHIPTAIHFDLKKLSLKRPDSPIDCPIPEINRFKDYVESLGITNRTEVVAYDSLNTRSSVRTWYLFKLFGHDNVKVLDGGMTTWKKMGYPVTQDEPDAASLRNPGTEFKVDFRPHNMILNYESMLKIVQRKDAQIVDSRPKSGGFYVTDEDKSGGHMPGAKSIPFDSMFNKDGTFKTEEDIRKLFSAAGVDVTAPMVATCLRGMTACALVLAVNILDRPMPMYNGSWFEWSARAEPKYIVREKEN